MEILMFALGIVSALVVIVAGLCIYASTKPATFEDMALNGRRVTEGVSGAPVFDEAIAYVDCEVRQHHDLGTHTLFIGEVIDAAVRDHDARSASMSDTRMKYGGVKRH